MALNLLTLPLILYLPGAALLWSVTSGPGSARGLAKLSPLPEMLASICLASGLGLALADARRFSLGSLCIGLLLFTASCVLVAIRRGPRPSGGRTATMLVSAVAIGVVVAGLYLPTFDTSIMGSDASFYRAAGTHLARHGALSIRDPLLDQLGIAERQLLFDRNLFGGWARIPGGLLLPTLDATTVYPSFSPLLPVWIAIAQAVGGPAAVDLVGPLFAWLALWTLWGVAREGWGSLAASLAVILVATNLAEWFYARFLMPEIVAQAILWGGILAFTVWWRDGTRAAGLLAAIALGTVAFVRVEEMLLVPLAVVLFFGWTGRRPLGAATFAMTYGAIVGCGLLRLLLVPTHYRDVLRVSAVAAASSLAHGPWGIGAVVASVLVAAVAFARSRRGCARRRLLVGALAATCAALFVFRSPVMVGTTAVWLAETSSWLVIATAVLGAVLLRTRPEARGFALAVLVVVGLPFLWNPHVMPVQLWGVRRFVPVIVPWLGLLAASVAGALARRGRALGLLFAGALVVANARPMWVLRGLPFFPSQAAPLSTLAQSIPDAAVVFVAPELTPYLVHLPLWTVHDREPLVLSPVGWAKTVAAVAPGLAATRPLVVLGHGLGPAPALDGIEVRTRADVELRTLTPEIDPLHAPTRGTAHLVPLRVYDLVLHP